MNRREPLKNMKRASNIKENACIRLKCGTPSNNETKGQISWHFVSFCPPLSPLYINWSTSNIKFFYPKLNTWVCNVHLPFLSFVMAQ